MIHEHEAIGCTYQYDRGRWVQSRSNVPKPDDLHPEDIWVPNTVAVAAAESVQIMRHLVPAFGRAKMEVREEDGASVARSYRMGRDWLLKFGFDEEGREMIQPPAMGQAHRQVEAARRGET